jgi:hypothetical protein
MPSTTYLPLSEASRRLGRSPDQLRRKIRAGELNAQRELRPQGHRWLVAVPDDLPTPEEAVSAFLTQPRGISEASELAMVLSRLVSALSTTPPPPVDFVPTSATSRQPSATLHSGGAQGSGTPDGTDVTQPPRSWWRRLLSV